MKRFLLETAAVWLDIPAAFATCIEAQCLVIGEHIEKAVQAIDDEGLPDYVKEIRQRKRAEEEARRQEEDD